MADDNIARVQQLVDTLMASLTARLELATSLMLDAIDATVEAIKASAETPDTTPELFAAEVDAAVTDGVALVKGYLGSENETCKIPDESC